MLNLDLSAHTPTAEHERLLTNLAQACLDDLCRRIAEAFKLDGGVRWTRGPGNTAPDAALPLACAFGVDSRAPLLIIAVAHDVLVELAKVALPPPAKLNHLSSLSDGLAAQNVAISAHVGRCVLTLAEVGALGVGDVLVFDRAVDAPLDVLLHGGGTTIARCTVARDGERFDLTLLDAIGGPL